MSTLSITPSDIVIVQNRNIIEYTSGTLQFSDTGDLVTMKSGHGGNAVITSKNPESSALLRLKIKTGSTDDRFLAAQKNQFDSDPPSFVLLAAKVKSKTFEHSLSGGIVSARNVQSDCVVYDLEFKNC